LPIDCHVTVPTVAAKVRFPTFVYQEGKGGFRPAQAEERPGD
jgi:hypothetical protein